MSTELKTFQVRDTHTHIPVMCVRVIPELADREFLRAGYRDVPYVIMTNLLTLETNYDTFKWEGHRTLSIAHTDILHNWSELHSGEVIDVQYILNETATKKEPE